MSFLQTLQTIELIALVIRSFHSTTLATASLNLTHILPLYLQTLMILETCGFPKISVTLVTGNACVVLDT